MKVERITVRACCGKTSLVFKLDRHIDANLLTFFTNNGFTENTHLTKSGILYVDNLDFTLSGALGANKLQAQCKIKDCTAKLDELEALLLQVE